MRHHLVSASLAAAFLLTSSTAFAARANVRTEYYLINGPDYRQVTRAVFEEYRDGHSCMRVETKLYPASGSSSAVRQSHCYL